MSYSMQEALRAVSKETTTVNLKKLCQQIVNENIDLPTVIGKLSQYVSKVDDAKLFRKYLSHLLLPIVSAKIPLTLFNDILEHIEFSLILSVLSDHPDILQYALKYFEINSTPPFEAYIHYKESYKDLPKKRRLSDNQTAFDDRQIVTCCYTFLRKMPNEFLGKWNWANFIENFCNHGNEEIRWMVKECMARISNMSEIQKKDISNFMNITEDVEIGCLLKQVKHDKIYAIDNVESMDLSKIDVVNLDGIILSIHNRENIQSSCLVPVKSTINNLRSVALAVASGKAISLLGPVGSGKTALVEHLASITGRKGVAFRKVQLGDQTDSRMLLGSHQCTDIPGEFVWRPGVLTEAVQNGHWLLLEDIDCAALDVASTLSSLLERKSLCVPGYRDALPVTPGFQLFVTQRMLVTNYGFQKKLSNSSTLLKKHITQINVEPLSRQELEEIIHTLYPSLKTVSPRMIKVFMMFSVGSHDSSLHIQETEIINDTPVSVMRGSRLISTRDLIKWCSRAVVEYNVSSSESALKILQDALDIFTCSVSSPQHRLDLARKVGLCLGIVESKSEFYCKHYKPNVSLNATSLEVGRAKVPRIEKTLDSVDFGNKEVVFSFTRQSASLLEKIACCVTLNEPVLLVGETGTGKTSSIQYLARQTGHKLVVINMNQQSDSADLLGGYKPVDLKFVILPIKNQFKDLFRSYYNVEKNKKFLSHIDNCYETENWAALIALMKQCQKSATLRIKSETTDKALKTWLIFGNKLLKLEKQIKAASRLTFAFIEGSLVKAMQQGHWVLLDEINLASAEILECLAGLLEDRSESVELLEKGDKVPIKRHPDFTLFACMNPATDVGKKDLPVGLRNRFTEFFIDELTERNDLMLLIGDYLYHLNLSGAVIEAIYSFYATVRKEAKLNLIDGSGNSPHYSLRTLCRALTAAAKAKCGTVARSLFESFCLSFLTQLDSSSHPKVEAMIAKAVIGKKSIKSVLNQEIPEPKILGQTYLLFEGHWIPKGKLDVDIPEGYILTSTVKKNLRDISRIISLGRLPILLQGDTSVGKTSLITYIAKASGNYCVRINNHEHTDLQEYIGAYAADADGKLVFKEGVLVEAMRKGFWIILDELNLAPSDVLEALNRVLDDNRELFIPETQQVIKADPNFMLFATQNPPGLYGGRKMLSRAFRNRFVELHFDEIPRIELETILHQRCHVPPAYSKKMISVMGELQVRRRESAAVQGKDGFITLRDLFRWGQRYNHASKEMLTDNKFYDWDQHLADEGYLVLAGKVRQPDERIIIENVIEKFIKRKVTPDNLFTLHEKTSPVTKHILELIMNNQLQEFAHVVWTYNMRRLAVLIGKAFIFTEPVLLVGETGCGKTTICQVLAALRNSKLLSVNCHMHTESSDFLGGLRPVRSRKEDDRLFEWVDGPLINAMENGHMFLADEISLADDSVLERLNSLLEPERQLVLAEKGLEDNRDVVVVTAIDNFHFIGTMNPGGDFGKKELSPALRNRFTEIWCDHVTSRQDLILVLEKSVNSNLCLTNDKLGTSGIGNLILDFTDWLKNCEATKKFPISIRDLLSWVQFINETVKKGLLSTSEAYVHGACMTFLDCFGTALTGQIDSESLADTRQNAIDFLLNQVKAFTDFKYSKALRDLLSNKKNNLDIEMDDKKFGIKPFYIDNGKHAVQLIDKKNFLAPTTALNALRLLRGLQLNKAILLEGNPGVGKTSLVTAVARLAGHNVVRINLSDQTDITDLFGTDLPCEDGSFKFQEGIFLRALLGGDWILLDELNLAPQPVLEGLNACLDHRGEIYIPELGMTFKVKEQTRLFACQNPLKQGGARRGLPLSFLNRFTQVYVDTLNDNDLMCILTEVYGYDATDIVERAVKFNSRVSKEITDHQLWGHKGSPWEMNLRDLMRWFDAMYADIAFEEGTKLSPGKYVDVLYIDRMRTREDKEKMAQLYDEIFGSEYPRSSPYPQLFINEEYISIGDVEVKRCYDKKFIENESADNKRMVLRNQLPALKSLLTSVNMNWLTILVGPTSAGKSSLVQSLADLMGHELHVLPITSATDVSDLIGGFEQLDYHRTLESIYVKLEKFTYKSLSRTNDFKSLHDATRFIERLHEYKTLRSQVTNGSSKDESEHLQKKIMFLIHHYDLLKQKFYYNIDDYDFLEMQEELNALKYRVHNAKLNTGGKFEWVSSLFIKAMLEGSWILLDNVNLTSSAILDRLNCLFEPEGYLSVPESGWDQISPMTDFKVFFTMDPKYGEISRAMRNRGVEIYVLGQDDFNDNLSEVMPCLDVDALLSSSELPSIYHNVALTCHEVLSAYVQGLEKPNTSQLIQASHLIWQQIVRGIPYKTALLSSFSDVYIKPRCSSDFATKTLSEMKCSMLKDLKNIVDSFEVINESMLIDLPHSLPINELGENSLFVASSQLAFAPIQHIRSSLISDKSLFTFFNIFTSYQKSTRKQKKYLHSILQNNLTNLNVQIEDIDLFKKLNEYAYTEYSTTGIKKSFISDRFNPDAKQIMETDINESNAFIIKLYYNFMKTFIQIKTSNESISALKYSQSVDSKQMVDYFVEYPILKYCKQYMEIIDCLILDSIESSEKHLNDSATCNILNLLNWRNRFFNMCSIPIMVQGYTKSIPILKEEIIPLLYIHSKWLQKYLLGYFLHLIPSESKLYERVKNSSQCIMIADQQDDIKIIKISKRFRKLMGQPSIYKKPNEYELCLNRYNAYNRIGLDLGQPLDKQLEKLSVDTGFLSDPSLAFDVPNNDVMQKLEENVLKTLNSKVDIVQTEMCIKLMPLHYYITLRVLSLLKNDLLSTVSKVPKNHSKSSCNEICQKILSSLVQLGKHTKGFPAVLLNILQLVENIKHYSDNRISSLPAVFWEQFYKLMSESPAVRPLPFINLNNSFTEDALLTIPLNTQKLSTNLPLLLYYIQNMTVSSAEGSLHLLAYETVPLKDRNNYSTMLNIVLDIVWKNIASLNTIALNKCISDASFEMKKFELLVLYLRNIADPASFSEFNEDTCSETIKALNVYCDSQDLGIFDTLKYAQETYNNLASSLTLCKDSKVKFLTAKLSLLTSLLGAKVIAEISDVDHVEKYKLKVKYFNEDIQIFDTLLTSYYTQGVVSGAIMEKERNILVCENDFEVDSRKTELSNVHPYCSILLDLKEKTAKSIEKYASGNTFRPENPSYNVFAKDCKHFSKSVLSQKTITDVSCNLINVCDNLQKSLDIAVNDTKALCNANRVSKETESWLYSVKSFYNKCQSTYSEAFPDLAKPLLSSLSQIIYSVTNLLDLTKEVAIKMEQGPLINNIVLDLMSYPNRIPSRNDKTKHLNRFLSSDFLSLLHRNTIAGNSDMLLSELESLEVLKMNLSELKMHCIAKERVDKCTSDVVLATLSALVNTWESQQRDIEKKKLDDEALYVTKSKCKDVNEDEEAYQEMMEMFPSYTDTDFSDFKPNTLEQKTNKPMHMNETNNKTRLLITSEDITIIYKWHSSFVRSNTYAEWLATPEKKNSNDVTSPLIMRYPTFSRVIQNAWQSLDLNLEGDISPSLMVLVSQIQNKINGDGLTNGKVDFYKSPWVSEVKQCVPLLNKVLESTNDLLEQWPDFPTLKDIIIIAKRILNFSVTSPVSRFLTGLELLRDKIEEWNKNAHKSNNLIEISLEVGQQIINWRKLEMAHWKECLNNLFQRKQAEAHKYWFYLYSVVESYLKCTDNELMSPERVINVLKDFMEISNFAEYEVRLDIIYVYHCHLIHLDASIRRDELLSIFWNTYNYYAQFLPHVLSYIKEKRAPIEKKLKDFVKICSWDRDLSYWSVKDTVDKAHKALHKHTKELEIVLKEPVTCCLVDNSTESTMEHVGIWDRPKRTTGANVPAGGAYMIDQQNYIAIVRNVKKYLDLADLPSDIIPEGSLLSKVSNLWNKARTLCKDTIMNTLYPTLVQSLDDFVTLIIETSTHLGSLDVDMTLPKEKQTNQAKNIVQQKRKALSDLFKYLTKMGLNYRTGLVILSASENDLYDFSIPPVDLNAAMKYLKNRRCDPTLALLWSGCEKYFQKNISRHRVLTSALLMPHRDLGIPNIERCKGFAAQLVKITNSQKKSISKYSRYLCDLRTLSNSLTSLLDMENQGTVIKNIKPKLDILLECFASIDLALDQFKVVLNSCPEKGVSEHYEPEFDAVLSESLIVRCYKNNDEWVSLYSKIRTISNNVNKHKSSLIKLNNILPHEIGRKYETPYASQNHVDTANEANDFLISLNIEVTNLLDAYEFRTNNEILTCKQHHPILKVIVDVSNYIKTTLNDLKSLDEATDVDMEEIRTEEPEIIQQTEDLIATMLLIIQLIYKKHLPIDKLSQNTDINVPADEGTDKDNDRTKDILEDGHLKELLQDKLSNDSKLLQLETLLSKTHKLILNYVECLDRSNSNIAEIKLNVMRLMPIFEQTVLFVQYFVSQKVALHRVTCKMLSVLLKIFSDLATKGFCKPSDVEMDDGEGDGGPGKMTSGTGLGDGEGQKDVSDRIENQDQLDEARKPGEDKNEEDRDCKEEEKGVNMTDDFDSHLQDVEKKEGEQSDDEDEDNADKQMGDIDNAAEKLDQQIWGQEDEDDEEDQPNKKDKEEKGTGESTGEKEMAAKEQKEDQDEGGEGKERKQKKDVNEMQEPEIDDDHVDPYHGKQPDLPEPEDFDLFENENEGNMSDDQEGETETENPFEIDAQKENNPETADNDEDDKNTDDKANKQGLEVSSDEEDENDTEKNQSNEGDDIDDGNKNENDNDENPQNDTEDQEAEDKQDGDTELQDGDQPENEIAPDDQELQRNPESLNEEDEKVQENKEEPNPQANPSNNDPSAGEKSENAEMDKGTNDNVETNEAQPKDEETAPYDQAQEQVGDEIQSTGRSELDKSDKGHRGDKQAAKKSDSNSDKKNKRENKPGRTDHDRTLGEVNDQKHKNAKTLNVEREDDDEAKDGGRDDDKSSETEADAYQHVKQAGKEDLQAIDAATKEQADQQPIIQEDEEEGEKLDDEEEVPMDVDDDDLQIDKSEEIKPESFKEGKEKDVDKSSKKKSGEDDVTGQTGMEVEGDNVLTSNVQRPDNTTYHTSLPKSTTQAEEMSLQHYMSLREWLHSGCDRSQFSTEAWRSACAKSSNDARALCEKLRLVLEPTGCSRRAGDFRTGRAINMRRVIPYIASHFRKDRIWLRRTKPAKREYKIAIAVDDSSSMSDNTSQELAFDSLALVSQALNLLESGDLAVLSFGEKPNLLHPFSEQFSELSGSRILEKLAFKQTKTKIAELLDFCTVMFEQETVKSDAFNAKLLLIVSDGRGIFSEGETKVIQSVRRARQQGIFLVYVVIDNPVNKDSIMDIRRPLLDTATNAIKFESYLDAFPFPFYLILRNISALPNVLGDALRQWFELAANTSS